MTTPQLTLLPDCASAAPARPYGVARVKRSYPMIARPTAEASNDRAFIAARPDRSELDAWAQRAEAASGFGAVTVDTYALSLQARKERAARLAEILETLFDAARDTAHRIAGSWRRAREARATYLALRQLDSRTLHDIGIDRSEMRSVAAELAGEADRTRMQAVRTLRMLALY